MATFEIARVPCQCLSWFIVWHVCGLWIAFLVVAGCSILCVLSDPFDIISVLCRGLFRMFFRDVVHCWAALSCFVQVEVRCLCVVVPVLCRVCGRVCSDCLFLCVHLSRFMFPTCFCLFLCFIRFFFFHFRDLVFRFFFFFLTFFFRLFSL